MYSLATRDPELQLLKRPACVFVHLMSLRRQLNPVASHDLRVGHEPDFEVNVRLIRRVAHVGKVPEVDFSLLEQALGRSNQFWNGQGDLDEVDFCVALKSNDFF